MSRLLKSSGVFAAMTLLSRLLGLIRDIVIAKYFSVEQTDVFFTALRIPNTLRRFFAEGGFANAFVPVLNETKTTQSDKALQSLINHVFGVLGLLLLCITLLGIIGAGYIISVIGFGFVTTPEKAELGTTMLRITFPYIFFISMTAFFAGILNTYQKFALPAFAPALLNVALITAALLFRDAFDPPVLVLAWAVFIGGLAQFLLQIPTLWRLKRLPTPKVSLANAGVRKILKLMVPTLLGSSAGQINILLNTALASSLMSGSITWLYYSDRLVELPVALIGVALGVVILPRLSALKAESNGKKFTQTLTWAFKVALLVGSAAATGLLMLAYPMMMTFFTRGEFNLYSAEMSAKSLMVFAYGALFLVLVKVLAPGFYARQNTKTPATIAILCIGINIIVALLLHQSFGHLGLAAASTIASGVNCSSLLWLLYRQQCLSLTPRFFWFVVKVLLANILMALTLWAVNSWFTSDIEWQDFTQLKRIHVLAVLILVGAFTYIATLLALQIKPKDILRPHA